MNEATIELFVLSGPDAGTSVVMSAGDRIGRGENCALRLRDRSISRQHARLEERSGKFVLVDTKSTNGISQSGERAAELAMEDYTEFKAGEVELRARLQAAPAAETKPERKPEPEISFSFGGGVATPEAEEPELEIEWDDEASSETETEAPQPAPAAPVETKDERAALIAQMVTKKSGLMQADLSQYPAWIQGLIGVGILAFGAGLFYGIFYLMTASRS